MNAGEHWLEIETGRNVTLSLRNSKGVIGESATLTKTGLRELAAMAPGVIEEVGPLRFYRTEKDLRISFVDPTEENHTSGFDRISFEDLGEALAPEKKPTKKTAPKRKKPTTGKKKKATTTQ